MCHDKEALPRSAAIEYNGLGGWSFNLADTQRSRRLYALSMIHS